MKGLQKLERIKKLSCVWNVDNDEFKDAAEIVPNAFKTIEKELKALQLSISKQVNWKLLIWSSKLEEYNDNAHNILMKLAQEEYDLLKEVLL